MSHNTKHVRSIMKKYGVMNENIWNNKYKHQTTVKCYVVEDTRTRLNRLTNLNNELVRNGYETQLTQSTHNGLRGVLARVWHDNIS